MSDYYDDPGIDPMVMQYLDMILNGNVGGMYGQGGGYGLPYLGAATPTLSPGQFNTMAGTIPQDDEVLRQQARGLNFGQDWVSSMADPMMLANVGLGGFAPNAFEPLVSNQVVQSPELEMFNAYLRNPLSYQGTIAQAISQGGNAMEAVGQLQQEIGLQPDFDDPALAPILAQLPKIYDNEPGGTGEVIGIDWTSIQSEAMEMANQWASIPPIGPTGLSINQETGEVISEGGERQLLGEPGSYQLMETTFTPSPMAEEYQRLGLPSPTEEFTPSYILGPEWEQAQRHYLEQSGPELDAARQAWQQAKPMTPEELERTFPFRSTVQQQPQPQPLPEERTVGTTDQPLTGGTGIAEQPIDFGPWTGGAVGGAPPSMADQASNTRSPDEYLDWYNANANSMTDEQRFEAAAYPQQMVLTMGGDPRVSFAWERISDAINNDFAATEQGGGLSGPSLPDLGDRNALILEAGQITDPVAFSDFIAANAGQLTADDLANLGGTAMSRATSSAGEDVANWDQVAQQLLSGQAPTPSAGGGGGRAMSLEEMTERQKAARGKAPTPPTPPQPLGSLYTTGAGAPPPPPPTPPPGPALLNQQWEPQGPPGTSASDQYMPTAMIQSLLQPSPAPPSRLHTQTSMRPGVYVGGYTPPVTTDTVTTAGPRPGPPPQPTTRRAGSYGDEHRQRGPLPASALTYTPDPNYEAPPGGFPTLEQAAAAGSQAAIQYLLENGPTPPPPTPTAAMAGTSPYGLNTPTSTRPGVYTGGYVPPYAGNPVTSPIPGRDQGALGTLYQTGQPAQPQQAGPNIAERLTTPSGSYGDEYRQPIETGERPAGSYGDEHREPGQQPGRPRGRRGGLFGVNVREGAMRRAGQQQQANYDRAFQEFLNAGKARVAERNQLYGADYGRAVAQSILLGQQGITPLTAVMAARQLPMQAMGVMSPNRLGGVMR